jgi:hypothetical protein
MSKRSKRGKGLSRIEREYEIRINDLQSVQAQLKEEMEFKFMHFSQALGPN